MEAHTNKTRIYEYVRPSIPSIVLVVSVKFIASISELFLPTVLAYMVDELAPLKDLPKLIIFGFIMLFCAATGFVGNVTANRMASKVAKTITREVRHDVYEKTISLSCRKADELTVPTLISRLTSDTYNVHNMLLSMQRIGVRAPILAIGGVIVAAFLDPMLTLILVILMPIVFTAVFIISRKGVKLYGDVQKGADDMVSMLREHMDGIRVIKALSKSDYERERFDKINENIYRRDRKAGLITGLSSPIMTLILNFGLVMVILVGAHRVSAGLSKSGAVIAFLSYFTIILNAMMMINRMFMQLSKGLASAGRLNEVLGAPLDIDCIECEDKPSENHVEFENVSFSYLGAKNNIENLSFAIKRGGTVGIIGGTGSGKTTVISLLLRFYEVGEGSIRIDGRDIRSIPRAELYAKFGSALQSDFLMSDTVYENISFCRGIENEDVEKAAAAAIAETFIADKPGGYDYKLDVKAANLSGGQKQRLLISRALAGDPEILIMDDSCGGLDYKTDAMLRGNLGRSYSESTKVIVAQRISSVKNSDLIIVMEDGRVIGMGTHEQLMERCELYRDTARAQMES